MTAYNQCLQQMSAVGAGPVENLDRFRGNRNIALANTNLSPKLAVSWSPWSNGKTALKATLGRSYNLIPLTIPLVELNPTLTDLVYRIRSNCRPFDLDEDGTIEPGEQLCQGRIPTLDNTINPAVNVQTVSRDLQTPYQDELTLAFERQLWTETTLKLQYVTRKFRDQIQDVNRNFKAGDYGRCVRQNNPDNPALEPSDEDNNGDGIEDDGVPGPGDGLLDDCIGNIVPLNITDEDGREQVFVERPDGVADLYKINPYWGDIFEVGNYNSADYDAFVAELTRRQYRSWELQASYTWSRLIGNGEDFFQDINDDPTLSQDERGFQSNDQRHVVKMNATTVTPWGIRLGTAVSWQSGLPYSLLRRKLSRDAVVPVVAGRFAPTGRARTVYLTNERNDQRNDSYWNVDLKATKELTLGRNLNLQLSAEVFNVLNDGTYIIYNTFDESGQQINGFNDAYRRFGREWQLGMKLAF